MEFIEGSDIDIAVCGTFPAKYNHGVSKKI
jgi:hypothetical protein